MFRFQHSTNCAQSFGLCMLVFYVVMATSCNYSPGYYVFQHKDNVPKGIHFLLSGPNLSPSSPNFQLESTAIKLSLILVSCVTSQTSIESQCWSHSAPRIRSRRNLAEINIASISLNLHRPAHHSEA